MTSGTHIESRRTERRARRAALALTAAALATALAACQSDDSASPASGPGPGAATAGAPASAAPAGPPLQPADYVLVAGPATASYTQQNNTDTTESTVFEEPVPTCMHLSAAELGPASTDHANGPVFETDEGLSINSGARVFATADTVSTHRALVARPDFPGCVGQAIVGQFSNRDQEASHSTVRSAVAATPPAGATALTRLDLTLAMDSQTVNVHVDLVSIFSGRVESVILIINPFTALPDSEVNAMTSQVAATLAKQ